MFLLEASWMEYVLSGTTMVEISKISGCTAASVLLLSSNSTQVSQMVVINIWILPWENFQVEKEWQIQKSLNISSSTWSEILGCSAMFLITLWWLGLSLCSSSLYEISLQFWVKNSNGGIISEAKEISVFWNYHVLKIAFDFLRVVTILPVA